VFNIDIEVCDRCGGAAKVIACIEDQGIIDRILDHLRRKEQETPTQPLLAPLSSTGITPYTAPLPRIYSYLLFMNIRNAYGYHQFESGRALGSIY